MGLTIQSRYLSDNLEYNAYDLEQLLLALTAWFLCIKAMMSYYGLWQFAWQAFD